MAGGDLPDPLLNEKFRHKLDFLEAMDAWFRGMRTKAKNRMIMVGDLNVAPLPTDVWSHKQLLKVVSHTPIEVERLARVQASHDWVDLMRRHVPAEEKLFTWWSYRNRDWRASNRGRRLDHIWATPSIAKASCGVEVVREGRELRLARRLRGEVGELLAFQDCLPRRCRRRGVALSHP